jgi:hypothetical protein
MPTGGIRFTALVWVIEATNSEINSLNGTVFRRGVIFVLKSRANGGYN